MKAKGTVQDFTITSEKLHESIEVLVYLPPNYSSLNKYPYVIAQDGKDYFQLGRLARTMDELLQEKVIQPFIVFGIPYKNVADRREKYHPQGSKTKQYIQFLVQEFIPFIEKNYSLINVASARALAGDSLAATVSLLTAMEYPYTIGNVILHSPFVDEIVLHKANEFKSWSQLSIYHVIGTEETSVSMTDGNIADFLTPNRELQRIISDYPADYFYDEFVGNHTWKYWQKDLRRAFPYIFPMNK
ncbi:alpha/beta hydrolase [Bacillus kwashiorkori]|uniref:alpha/beta hydrolase n=1 Tax=Bacillus kwashiorkori TaxID=1522318 RepID=UPI0007831467|nr:alpha/beta hydrolase-fold protein [Bacillus kwashiorkori]